MTRKAYSATAERDGKVWLVHVPEVDRYTQARSLREAGVMAADLVAIMTDSDPGSFDVTVTVELPSAARTYLERAHEQRERAAEANAAAADYSRKAARELADAGLTMRDIGQALGVSHQRAHQLVNDPIRPDIFFGDAVVADVSSDGLRDRTTYRDGLASRSATRSATSGRAGGGKSRMVSKG